MRKSDLEGYFLIDHTDCEGFTEQDAKNIGKPGLQLFAGAGQKFEAATLYCNHCEAIAIKNPLRTRERGHCIKCDHYICDNCAIEFHRTLVCKPFKQIIDEFYSDAKKAAAVI